jgi:hypothetical protein
VVSTQSTRSLAIVTVTGLIYNIGLIAGPWFEGQMAQCLENIFKGRAGFPDMARLVALYVTVIAAVQLARELKETLCAPVRQRDGQTHEGDSVRESHSQEQR